MRGPALLRRLHGRARHRPPETDGGSAARGELRARPRGHSGVRPPRLQNAHGAAFPVGGTNPGRGAQTARTARERRRIRRPADHHCRGVARGVRARDRETIRRIPRVARPDYCLNVGITWPGLVALEIEERVPTLSFKSFGAFIEGAAQRAESIGDTGTSAPENWVGGFGSGRRSRPADAARHQPGSDGGLQRPVVCLVRRRRCLPRALAPGRDGA